MYARKVGDTALTFDFAEGLINNNLLFVDRETQSIWSQLDGKAVSGPMKDTPLKVLPALQTTWKFWHEKYPNTKVMIVKDKAGFPYFYRNRRPGSPHPKQASKEHDISNLGLGLVINHKAMYFSFHELSKTETPLKLEIGGKTVVINYASEALTAWAEESNGNLLTGVLSYKDGWLDFFPQSEIFSVTNTKN